MKFTASGNLSTKNWSGKYCVWAVQIVSIQDARVCPTTAGHFTKIKQEDESTEWEVGQFGLDVGMKKENTKLDRLEEKLLLLPIV